MPYHHLLRLFSYHLTNFPFLSLTLPYTSYHTHISSLAPRIPCIYHSTDKLHSINNYPFHSHLSLDCGPSDGRKHVLFSFLTLGSMPSSDRYLVTVCLINVDRSDIQNNCLTTPNTPCSHRNCIPHLDGKHKGHDSQARAATDNASSCQVAEAEPAAANRGWRMSCFCIAHQDLHCLLLVLHHLWAIQSRYF